MASPLLIDIPETLTTERLLIRHPMAGDGAMINAAIRESHAELKPWMPWAQELPTVEESEAFARRSHGQFVLRENLNLILLDRVGGAFVGASGFHLPEWNLRKFEIGYWCRTSSRGRGYITEAVIALTAMALDLFAARRIEIRTDDLNVASYRVAERAGYTLEGTFVNDSLDPQGRARSTRVYAKVPSPD